MNQKKDDKTIAEDDNKRNIEHNAELLILHDIITDIKKVKKNENGKYR